MRSGGRPRDAALLDERLAVWRREALERTAVAEIAARLGMTRAALNKMVERARAAGHRDAVYHGSGSGRRIEHPTHEQRIKRAQHIRRYLRLRAAAGKASTKVATRTDAT